MLQKPFKPGYICIARCAFTYSVAFNTINNGPKNNLAVLTGGLLTGGFFLFFLQENVWPFCLTAKKVAAT